MSRADLESLLHELGRLPVEAPDELALARIESRWRARVGVGQHPIVRTRRTRRSLAIGSAVALVAAAASVAVVVGTQHDDNPDLVVAAAQGVTIELPDGVSIEAQAGEALPEGATVIGGPRASGVIGTIFVGPGSAFIVREGRLVAASSTALDDPSQDSSATTTSSTTIGPPTSAPTATTAARPGAPAPTAPNSPRTTTTPRSKPQPAKRLSVSAQRTKPTVRISWVAPTDTGVVRYVVVRAKKWNGRTLPQGKRIATVRSGRTLTATDSRPVDGQFYVVAAFGPKNRLVAIGSVSTPPS